ncbi:MULTISPECIES: hypothetical protein [unclassified Nocardiopsis]|uniref:hypothetical protein n=1 Tax=Nocardiopsis TaxID=2013 RepID=UPI00387AF194
MKTRVPALFTAGVLALSLAACGSEEAPEPTEEATEAAAEEEKGGSIFDLLSSMDDSTRELTNYTLFVEVTSEDPDLGEFSAEMTFEAMDDPKAVQTTVFMPDMADMILEMTGVTAEDLGVTAEDLGTTIIITPAEGEPLLSNHTGLEEADTPWVRGTPEAQDATAEEMFDLEEFPGLVAAFAEIEEMEEVGSEKVNGADTTMVKGSLTQDQVDAMDAEAKLAVLEFIGGDIIGTLDVAIWISEDGFPLKLDMSDDDFEMNLEFSEIGTTSFEIPAEDQITDL